MEAVELDEFGWQTSQFIDAEVKVLEAGELTDFRGQTSQLIAAEVKVLEAGELTDFGGKTAQLIPYRAFIVNPFPQHQHFQLLQLPQLRGQRLQLQPR